ncbi:sulfurtransferase [Kaistia sp. 32K]|uniref:sulfurtransferase n=1 Tax=Kaistia sp. 32K TaxID=2795690 RepID=UPI001914FEE2|nr:sulfurtransferase [Kaistia sp. 32K]BCP52199.1 sulfurtransferase [Kaistia sp. 32K]
MTNWLLETAELADLIEGQAENLVVLDCSWYLPEAGKHARDDFLAGHIPGARFIDLADISDPDSPYVNMLPAAELFAAHVGRLGIGNDTDVVIYDAGYVSCRLWWMFRTFGHDKVRILNGGWRKWKAEGRAIETGAGEPVEARAFEARLKPGRVVTIDDVRAAIDRGDTTIVDARTAARFDGLEGSGYPGVASGYMPGAINTPWARFFDASKNFEFVSPEAASAIFEQAGADISGNVITTCGSGVTACILGFMIEQSGNADWRLYDGSWHEWGQQPDTVKLVKQPG